MDAPLSHPLAGYFFISSALFVLGVFTMVSRKNAIYVLMGAELILNAAALNFVAFARYGQAAPGSSPLDGQMFAIFIMTVTRA